jgi:hypothetical protein
MVYMLLFTSLLLHSNVKRPGGIPAQSMETGDCKLFFIVSDKFLTEQDYRRIKNGL